MIVAVSGGSFQSSCEGSEAKRTATQAVIILKVRCEEGRGWAYEVSQRIQLLAHERRLLPPPRDLAVHKVEEQAQRYEAERKVQVGVVVRVVLDAVPQGGEDGHDAAEAWSVRLACGHAETSDVSCFVGWKGCIRERRTI